jgi:hypothetical protein
MIGGGRRARSLNRGIIEYLYTVHCTVSSLLIGGGRRARSLNIVIIQFLYFQQSSDWRRQESQEPELRDHRVLVHCTVSSLLIGGGRRARTV